MFNIRFSWPLVCRSQSIINNTEWNIFPLRFSSCLADPLSSAEHAGVLSKGKIRFQFGCVCYQSWYWKRNRMFSNLPLCWGELIHGEVSDFRRVSEQLSRIDQPIFNYQSFPESCQYAPLICFLCSDRMYSGNAVRWRCLCSSHYAWEEDRECLRFHKLVLWLFWAAYFKSNRNFY